MRPTLELKLGYIFGQLTFIFKKLTDQKLNKSICQNPDLDFHKNFNFLACLADQSLFPNKSEKVTEILIHTQAKRIIPIFPRPTKLKVTQMV